MSKEAIIHGHLIVYEKLWRACVWLLLYTGYPQLIQNNKEAKLKILL